MSYNLKNRSFVKEIDFTPKEFTFLLDLAKDLKAAKYAGTERPRLGGRNIALVFEKTSTRTRAAFEVASYDQGAQVTYLDPSSSQMGHKESAADTARVLGRMYDAIEYRDQMYQLFNLGMLRLDERAKVEGLFWSIADKAVRFSKSAKYTQEEFVELESRMHHKYICNFPVFQSLPRAPDSRTGMMLFRPSLAHSVFTGNWRMDTTVCPFFLE